MEELIDKDVYFHKGLMKKIYNEVHDFCDSQDGSNKMSLMLSLLRGITISIGSTYINKLNEIEYQTELQNIGDLFDTISMVTNNACSYKINLDE